MQTQIAQLVEEFNKNVRPRVSAEYWAKASQAFDIFWKKQIMTGNLAKTQGREIDDLKNFESLKVFFERCLKNHNT